MISKHGAEHYRWGAGCDWWHLLAAYVQLGCWGGACSFTSPCSSSRASHTVTYLWPRQPLRNRAYRVGLTVMLALCGYIVWAVVGR